ncbi:MULTISPECIES: discoidin domain-containing protein [Deinococcus]|uniref:Discoidin domain-containing protein n=1 Tax=Deinococcus rufus TaxID=2136097 RepID=A0ABV7Z3V9_9DEIO|nr:discoidin domain-containing protein [Deinococcus sp. AB2017081]WQE95953.1 discoidin domain-containing protein [Deinococcus sp. AB2017081]
MNTPLSSSLARATLVASLGLLLGGCSEQAAPTTAAASPTLGALATCATPNLALNRASMSSSNETNANLSGAAFDGNTTTRWSSAFSDPQWVYVDLGSVQTLCQVTLQWEAASARAFKLQVSNDASTWTDVYSTTTGAGGTQTIPVTGSGRYVRMYGTARNTTYGYSLYELQVNGPATTTPTGPVCFYADPNYLGESFCASTDSSWVGSTWNDRISSVRVQPGYQVQLFNDITYGGTSKTLTANAASLPDFDNLASSFRVSQVVSLPTSDTPNFGPNVKIYDPSVPAATIQADIDAAFNAGKLNASAQFGSQRYTFLFKPGNYGRVWANIGFYTHIAGLGLNPDDVTINGAVNVDSGWNAGDETNATQNFWRSAENLAVVPEGGTNRWAVSQAAPMRRVHIRGALTLAPSNQGNPTGYASGGYLADARVDGAVSSGSQQQWYTRDSSIGSWNGGVWNMVFSGVSGAPAQAFPNPPHTTLATTPVSREKPYLYIDSAGKYRVFVPNLRTNASGATWPNTPGSSIPLNQFYVAKPTDSAATLNQALAQGLNLFFTPGVYRINQTLNVTRANTVLYGLGFPTLIPEGGVNAIQTADVDGVKISGLLFDAGTTNSAALLTIGTAGSHVSHAANPTSVQDVFFRIGGAVAGKATTSLIVNSDHTLIDHIWAWRADHGTSPTGWTINTADTGLIVNGHNVLATGLFVEHYQKYEVIWNGQGGKTIFFQNEKPYDVPDNATWRSGANGYAAYKVADSVTTHEGWGMGVYSFFNVNPSVHVDRGFEVPNVAGVKFHDLLTVSLGNTGTIDHVINTTGPVAPQPGTNTSPSNVVSYP